MVTAYGRVSTDKQDERSQKNIIAEYCASVGLKVDKWTFETISSRTNRTERELAEILDGIRKGDTLIVSEPSRLARGGMIELAGVVDTVKQKSGKLVVVNGLNGKPLVFAPGKETDQLAEIALAVIGWSANMERQNISERTRSALKARKEAGVKLGRPAGTFLDSEQAGAVEKYMAMGLPKTVVAKLAGITRGRLLRYLKTQRTVNRT